MSNEIRDTVNYTLYDDYRIVYHGITCDIDRRINEHRSNGLRFTRYECSAKRTRSSALEYEREALETYKRATGRLPKYNEIL